MKIKLTKDQIGNKAGDIVEVNDPVVAESFVKAGLATIEPDPLQAIVEQLDQRISSALGKMINEFANAQTKSRRHQIPALFGQGKTGDPERTFGRFLVALRTGDRKTLEAMGSEWESWNKTTMTEGQGTTGGFLVPTEHYDAVMMYAIQAGVMRKHAIVIPQSAKETEVPCLDVVTAPSSGNNAMLGGAVFNWTEEATAITETNPTLKMARLINYELSGFTYLSNTLIEDSAIETIIQMIFGLGIAWTEDYAFFRGNGAGKPQGILSWAGLKSNTRSAASAFALADAGTLLANMIPSNSGRRFWTFSPSAVAKLYSLLLTAASAMNDLTVNGGASGRFLGLPFYVLDFMPALNTLGDVLLCDGMGYIIGDRKRLAIAFSEGPRFTSNQTTWRVVNRVGGRPWPTTLTTLPDATTTVSPFNGLTAG